MKLYTLHKIFTLLFFLLSLQGFTQEKFNQTYLYQVGIPDSLYSETLQEQRDIWIKFPEYYNPESDTKYPVVYILDGGMQLKALAAVCAYYEGHFLPDMLLVGISNRSNRMRDLTPTEMKVRYGGAVEEETGGAEKFTQFIEAELIPFIEHKYPASSYRTLIGHSFAGLFTVNTLLHHPQLFENYIAIDPSLDWDEQNLLKQSKSILEQGNFGGKSLFVSMSAASLHMQKGDITLENIMEDDSDYTLFARSIIEFSEFADDQKQNELNFSWNSYPDDLHGTLPLPSIRDGLLFLFDWYRLESFWKYNDPETPASELIDLIEKRERKLSEHFGYPVAPLEEELLNMMGYMALQFGQPDKSYAFFALAIKYFPESPNVYDSMADYYSSQNDLDNAVLNLKKAFEITGNENYQERIEEMMKIEQE